LNVLKKSKLATVAAFSAVLFAAGSASALTIGVYSENVVAQGVAGNIVSGQGHTFVNLPSLAAGSLMGLNVVWYMNEDNNVQGQVGNAAAVSNFVMGGGVFVMNDREVENAASFVPGGAGLTFVRDFSDDVNIDVIDGSTSLTNGPGGLIDNTTLDDGNSSSHGYVAAASLPAMAMGILSRTDADEIVDVTYMLGNGAVHYSTIPLDFYLEGETPAEFEDVYAPNLVSYAADLWTAKNGEPVAIAEPATLALFGLGLAGLAFARRRRSL
jgi:hypothetical protein